MRQRDNSAAREALQQHINWLRSLPQLPEKAAPDVAEALEDQLRNNIEAGAAPDGSAWQLTKRGRQPLQNAMRAVTITVTGARIVAEVTGHHARHHLGAVWGKVKRQILPSRRLPQPVIAAIREAITKHFLDRDDG